MKISVIMGVYNGSNGLEAAINSILNQSYKDFEFIICDDASTDNSYQILQAFAKSDARIKILRNKKNKGLSETLNKCINESKGEYIARMDDDDVAHPNRFNVQLKFLEENSQYSIVGTGRNLYDENGIWGTISDGGERTKKQIFLRKSFAHPTVMMRRDHLINVGCYSNKNVALRTEDYDLWCKFYYNNYKGYNLPDVLLDYYEAENSMVKRKYKYRINEFKLRRFWRKKFDYSIIYAPYSVKPLLVGLIPISLMIKIRKLKFK